MLTRIKITLKGNGTASEHDLIFFDGNQLFWYRRSRRSLKGVQYHQRGMVGGSIMAPVRLWRWNGNINSKGYWNNCMRSDGFVYDNKALKWFT